VKERFDDIFDATKHNKYLELIRTKRKQIVDGILGLLYVHKFLTVLLKPEKFMIHGIVNCQLLLYIQTRYRKKVKFVHNF